MPQEPLRHRMRGADAIFLYFEKKEMPLHIGSVAILDGDFDEDCVKSTGGAPAGNSRATGSG